MKLIIFHNFLLTLDFLHSIPQMIKIKALNAKMYDIAFTLKIGLVGLYCLARLFLQ